jgi:hypothetical protein
MGRVLRGDKEQASTGSDHRNKTWEELGKS